MGKLRVLRGILRPWNKEVFSDVKTRKQEILNKSEELDPKEVEGFLDPALERERDTLKESLLI